MTSGVVDTRTTLPPLPADLVACFGPHTLVPRPQGKGSLSAAEVERLVAQLKISEWAHDRCGRRLIAFYEALAAGLKGR
ncbi:hypothetical protein [Rhodoplanes elegans]|uniref:hypothetical protein n=1 Tax=Rhodoplanes elegans TaxID=29408 RepID=UPI001475EBEB|nr:hypothetical protein [Rhodoplanes elegans]